MGRPLYHIGSVPSPVAVGGIGWGNLSQCSPVAAQYHLLNGHVHPDLRVVEVAEAILGIAGLLLERSGACTRLKRWHQVSNSSERAAPRPASSC